MAAIKLVDVTEAKDGPATFELRPEALDALATMKGPLHVLAIEGVSRKGYVSLACLDPNCCTSAITMGALLQKVDVSKPIRPISWRGHERALPCRLW